MKKKILSLLTAFAMVFGIIAAPFTSAKAAEGEPVKIKVNLHKVLISQDALDAHDVNKKYDPTKGIDNIKDFFGDDIDK